LRREEELINTVAINPKGGYLIMMVASTVWRRAGGTSMCTYLRNCVLQCAGDIDVLYGFALSQDGVSACLADRTYDMRRVQLIFWAKDCFLQRGADAPELPAEELLMAAVR
jgi:hypothetical protein